MSMCLPILCSLLLTGAFSVWKIYFITWQQWCLNVVEVVECCVFSFYLHLWVIVIDTLHVSRESCVDILADSWHPIVSICFNHSFAAFSHIDLGTALTFIRALMRCESCNFCRKRRLHEKHDLYFILGELDGVIVKPVDLLTLKLFILTRWNVIKLDAKCDHVYGHEDIGSQGD